MLVRKNMKIKKKEKEKKRCQVFEKGDKLHMIQVLEPEAECFTTPRKVTKSNGECMATSQPKFKSAGHSTAGYNCI